jgi:hypothetical protein
LLGLHVSATAELNPFNEFTLTVVTVEFPATVVVDTGFTLIPKLLTVKPYTADLGWPLLVPVTVTV